MSDIEKWELEEKLNQLKLELQSVCSWINGTVIEASRKQGKTRKPFYYLSQSIKGKTKTTYIAARHLDSFKEACEEGKRLKAILSKINLINIELIKRGSSDAS